MSYSTQLLLTLSSLLLAKASAEGTPPAGGGSDPTLSDVLDPALQRLKGLVEGFLAQPVSPARTQQFEQDVHEALRELGRGVVQHTYNRLEPADVHALPRHVHFEAGLYTRL